MLARHTPHHQALAPTTDTPRGFAVVTSVSVDASYNFPQTELTAMSNNIAQLIQDIDRLDLHRRNMMEELKDLRDITLFYNKRHPEHRAAEPTSIAEDKQDSSTRQHDTETAKKAYHPRETDDSRGQQHEQDSLNSR